MSTVNVAIHASQFPDHVTRDLLQSLRARQVNHKFLYESYKQSQKWLAVHQAHSPWRTDPNVVATYDSSFAGVAGRLQALAIHVVGLGSGDGQKDVRLLNLLDHAGKELSYFPVDISLALILRAQKAASDALDAGRSPFGTSHLSGLICDLAAADNLKTMLDRQTSAGAARLLTFFGMMPNFEPSMILPKIRALLRPQDFVLLSANLAPGADYQAGVQRILPQYDNVLTRDWLLTFLLDLGMEPKDGKIEWFVEATEDNGDLLRVTAGYRFSRSRVLKVAEETFAFRPGEMIRLFFSYRYTPSRLRTMLAKHRFQVEEDWITASQEEGVFLCRARE
jgi:uncharacterized SAM-dependent methyltransferase